MEIHTLLVTFFYIWSGLGFGIMLFYAYWSYQRRQNGTFAIPKDKIEKETKWATEERKKFREMNIEQKLTDLLGEDEFKKLQKKYKKT